MQEDNDVQLLAGVRPEEFVLGLCVQRCADVSHAVSSRAMSAISKFSSKLLAFAVSSSSTGAGSAGSSQQAQGPSTSHTAWTRERLHDLADILCGEQALLLDEARLCTFTTAVDAADGGESSDEEGVDNARGSGGAAASRGTCGEASARKNITSTRGGSSRRRDDDEEDEYVPGFRPWRRCFRTNLL